MTTYEKIKELCEKEGFSISALSQNIPGLSVNKASITGWKNGSKPRPDKIKAIANYFGVSTEYLLNDAVTVEASHNTINGNGNTVSNGFTEQQKVLVDMFNKMDVVQQAQILTYAAELLKSKSPGRAEAKEVCICLENRKRA